jgi:hypothetical protein
MVRGIHGLLEPMVYSTEKALFALNSIVEIAFISVEAK